MICCLMVNIVTQAVRLTGPGIRPAGELWGRSGEGYHTVYLRLERIITLDIWGRSGEVYHNR